LVASLARARYYKNKAFKLSTPALLPAQEKQLSSLEKQKASAAKIKRLRLRFKQNAGIQQDD
jgi:hypothetical protein